MGDDRKVSDAARALGRLGAAQGGKARAAKLTAEERREIAQQAAAARWGKAVGPALPTATHGSPDRPLRLGPGDALGHHLLADAVAGDHRDLLLALMCFIILQFTARAV